MYTTTIIVAKVELVRRSHVHHVVPLLNAFLGSLSCFSSVFFACMCEFKKLSQQKRLENFQPTRRSVYAVHFSERKFGACKLTVKNREFIKIATRRIKNRKLMRCFGSTRRLSRFLFRVFVLKVLPRIPWQFVHYYPTTSYQRHTVFILFSHSRLGRLKIGEPDR